MKLTKIKQFSFPQKSSQSLPNSNRRKIYKNRNLNIKIELGNPYPTYNIKQKEFTKPHPSREYTRFPKTKIALTGMDVSGNLLEFMSKDIIHPLARPSLYENYDIKNEKNLKNNDLNSTHPNPPIKWALKTAARAPNYEFLPKLQPFQTYYFPPEYNNKEPEKYKIYSLKTDHIGIKIPKINRVNSEKSFLKMKAGYSASNETKTENQWVPYVGEISNINTSSKNYNIINFQPFKNRKSNCRLLDKSLNFRKKGIGEYYDLTNVFNKNFNKEFSMKFEENPKRFYKYNGAFTNMYDASNRNGKITLPFDLSEN